MYFKLYATWLLIFYCNITYVHSQVELIGWASIGEGTSGGQGGQAVTVTDRAGFVEAVSSPLPYIVRVRDTIALNLYERVKVQSNKTILGLGGDATLLYGGLEIEGDNVIVQNLTITGSYDGDWDGKTHSTDAITIYGKYVWVDHCNLSASADGLLDITSSSNSRVADYVTVSWTKFHNHNKVMLLGSSDGNTRDRGHLRTTIHHCWFDGWHDRGIHQRMPRTRYSDLHILNNYYDKIAFYCVGARFESDIVIENNYFRQSSDPHFIDDIGLGEKDPEVVARGNIYELTNGTMDINGTAFEPKDFYSYEAHDPMTIPAMVMNEAGTFNDPANKAPVAVNDTVYFDRPSGSAVIDVTHNDYDIDGGELRVAVVVNIPQGIHRIRDNNILYLASGITRNRDTLMYQLVDTQGGIDTAMVLIVFGELTNIDNRSNEYFHIYPNPAKNNVWIEWVGNPNIVDDIEVLDMTGHKYEIHIDRQATNQYSLNTRFLTAGMYLLKVHTQNGFFHKKLLILAPDN